MGIYDRDYIRNSSRGGFGSFSMWSVTTWLIVINIAVFLLDPIFGRMLRPHDDPYAYYRPLTEWGAFSVRQGILNGQVWRFITFQFLHAGVQHIFGNMLGLYFFGPMVESLFGGRRYLAFYLSCGVVGALTCAALQSSQVVSGGLNSTMVGASAGLFGILIASAKLAPDMQITLMFPPIPMKLRTLAIVYIVIAFYVVMTDGGNSGGEAGHLGGALWGFLLTNNRHWLNIIPAAGPLIARSRRRGNMRITKDWRNDMNR